jgi:hypothetical protein
LNQHKAAKKAFTNILLSPRLPSGDPAGHDETEAAVQNKRTPDKKQSVPDDARDTSLA